MFPISYCLIFTFHPKLNIEKIIALKSLSQTLDQLKKLKIEEIDQITAKQLENCALAVFNKTSKFSASEMFSTELKFVSDCLKVWFQKIYIKEDI